MNKYKNNKKIVLIVAGIGDTLCSTNSRKKIRNNESFVEQVKKVISHVTEEPSYYALVNFHYPSDTFKDVNVFDGYPATKNVSLKIHSNSLLLKDNEMALTARDGEELLFNGDDFTFIFRPEEYDIYMCGIDLHGIFANSIKDLLSEGYNVHLFSDALSAFPQTHKYVNNLQKNKNFEFCSYKSV